MIEIIEGSKHRNVFRVKCKYCGCVFQADKYEFMFSDSWEYEWMQSEPYEAFYSIHCPACGQLNVYSNEEVTFITIKDITCL